MHSGQIEMELPSEIVPKRDWTGHCVACMTTRDRLSAETRLCSYCDSGNCTIANAAWCREMGYMHDPLLSGDWT